MCTGSQDVFQGEFPFAIDDKGGENFVGRGVSRVSLLQQGMHD